MAEKKEEDSCLLLKGSSSWPNEAIFFVLAYLPLFELLTITRVCKSLRDAVNDDVLLWLKIVVERPLSWRISDNILIHVASRAKGRLQFLALINCVNITDHGLLRLVSQNPHITKLHIPGCTNLSPAGIIESVKLLTNNSNHRLQSLQINGVHGIKKEDLETLENLMINRNHQTRKETPDKILYHTYRKYKDNYINRLIDVEICPKCDETRIVFDCINGAACGHCTRGCESCVPRCVECGICVRGDEELEEASCTDTLCLNCWLKLPKCNHCNKPYCNEHAYLRHPVVLSGSDTGFVCADCHSSQFI
ncbi:hypothetical protein ABFX02_05G043900 [Erythranthe guttata]